jgi:hypothetical protein
MPMGDRRYGLLINLEFPPSRNLNYYFRTLHFILVSIFSIEVTVCKIK